MSDASITIKNHQLIADKVLNTNPIACTPNVPTTRSNNLIQSGGNWAYERFNHSSTPSYGYGKAGAPIAQELKANIYPALSENPSYNHCGGRKKEPSEKLKLNANIKKEPSEKLKLNANTKKETSEIVKLNVNIKKEPSEKLKLNKIREKKIKIKEKHKQKT